jgi:hypothetical protein
MSTVTVYKNEHEVFRNTIHQDFYVVETSNGELIWHEDRPGVIKVWLQVANSTIRLPFVLPDWQLIIDNAWMEKEFYQDIEDLMELKGKVIELRYKEYRFVFQFE